jgi:hypothetical protein
MGLKSPQQLQRVWQGKLRAVMQSAAQMDTSLRSLDPYERENAMDYIRALGDAQPAADEQASSSTKETGKQKKRRKG